MSLKLLTFATVDAGGEVVRGGVHQPAASSKSLSASWFLLALFGGCSGSSSCVMSKLDDGVGAVWDHTLMREDVGVAICTAWQGSSASRHRGRC